MRHQTLRNGDSDHDEPWCSPTGRLHPYELIGIDFSQRRDQTWRGVIAEGALDAIEVPNSISFDYAALESRMAAYLSSSMRPIIGRLLIWIGGILVVMGRKLQAAAWTTHLEEDR